MKNLFVYSGITFVVLANIAYTTFNVKSEVGTSLVPKKEIVLRKTAKSAIVNSNKSSIVNESTTLKTKKNICKSFPKSDVIKVIGSDEPLEVISTIKVNKTADELIAEDNLITDSNLSNETQALDFGLINKSLGFEFIEPVIVFNTEKTSDELIAEDNLITDSNLSNETQALDFGLINKSLGFEFIEPVIVFNTEKTADELISEDNLITESNLSNETQALDFEIINRISKPRI